MTPCRLDPVQAATDALHGHGGKGLVARVVRTTHDNHTDAHLGLGLILVLVLDLSCPMPAVGDAVVTSFARAHPCGWVCAFISSARDRSPAVDPLFPPWLLSPLPRRRRSRAPNSHYL